MTTIAGIGTLARLNDDENEFSDRSVEDHIVVDFCLFAELGDGRRVETVAVYQEGGPRTFWGPVEATPSLSFRALAWRAWRRL